MNSSVDLAEMVHHWSTDEVVTWTPLHDKDTVWLVTTAAGAEFVLK